MLPAKISDFSAAGISLSFNIESLLDAEGEKMVADAYGFSDEQVRSIEKDLLEAIHYRSSAAANARGDEEIDELDNNETGEQPNDDGDSDFVLDYSPAATEEAHVNYLLGTAFGRWDIRFATGERQPPELPDPFDPLPVCPPGMLQGDDGLSLSETEFHRQYAVGSKQRAEGGGEEEAKREGKLLYPLRISWPGILVDDENHPEDIVARVREAIEVIWKDRSEAIEQEACGILGVKTLRDYFRRPAGFFADHLKRYSKSRRQAPIYWPLSTASGSYTLWVYYHRLNNDTLYKCLQQFVEPKIKEVEEDIRRLRAMLGTAEGGARERRQLDDAESLLAELRDLHAELARWAPRWKPNLNDGVQVTACPLWKLFRLPKWQKTLKDTWQDLEKGEYDWAHLAYTLWPDRVREKCKKDRSLAIAHGMEEICEIKPAEGKKKRAKKKAAKKKGKAAKGEDDEPELIKED